MSGRDKQFIHPYTYFLVDEVQKIMEYLRLSDYHGAVEQSYNLMLILDIDLRELLEKQEALIEQTKEKASNQTGLDQYDKIQKQRYVENLECRKIYRSVIGDLMRELHKAGYFREARGTFFDPSGGRKSGETEHEGYPSVIKAKT